MSFSGRPLVHSFELLQETNVFQSIGLSNKQLLDIVFKPWACSEVDLAQELFPESDLAHALISVYSPELLDIAPDEIGDRWETEVVNPFLNEYKLGLNGSRTRDIVLI